MDNVHFTSKSQTWNTPKDFYDLLNSVWGFTLDVACLEDSALCTKYFTPDDDGLVQDWGKEICWMNPPYNDIKSWCAKAQDAYLKGATVVGLIPARTDTKAFHDHIVQDCSCICFVKGRLKFYNGGDTLNSAPFPSMLFILDKDLTTEKIKVLDSIGSVLKHKGK